MSHMAIVAIVVRQKEKQKKKRVIILDFEIFLKQLMVNAEESSYYYSSV